MTIEEDVKEGEMKAVEELKERLKDGMDPKLFQDTSMFRRFLRARDLNVKLAEIMLSKHLEWRKTMDVDNILTEYKISEVLGKHFPNNFIGYNKDGCVVRYVHFGNVDIAGILSSCTKEELKKFVIHEFETEISLCKKGPNPEKVSEYCIYIYNMENFSIAKCTDKKVLQMLIQFIGMYINNYPETLSKAFIIHVPSYFSIIQSILKSILPQNVLQKIHFYSHDSYKKDLLESIDADVLPKFLGGNRTDPDGNPLCLSYINHGGDEVPEEYYLERKKMQLSKDPDVQKLTLNRAEFHEVKLEVEEPGSFLEWEFETKCRDIGFGLFYQEMSENEGEDISAIIPIQRIDTEEYPETGRCPCDEAGTYVIVFDNTYSWVRSKEIYFRIRVVTPREHECELKE